MRTIFKSSYVKFFILSTMIFNIIDIFVTVRFIRYGNYNENNPFMKFFLNMEGIMPFVFAKSFLICAGCYFLFKYRDKLMAQIGSYLCFCFYWALIVQFYYFLIIK